MALRRALAFILVLSIVLPMTVPGIVGGSEDAAPVFSVPISNNVHAQAGPGETVPWWERTSMDLDRNGIWDRLDDRISPGVRGTVNIFVDYSRDVTGSDLARLTALGLEPMNVHQFIHVVSVPDVPLATIPAIARLPGVVMVEEAVAPAPLSDVATSAIKARESAEYSPNTAWELGVSGKGVNVCIMDTGIDDAHPSLAGKWVGGADFTKPEGPAGLFPRDGTYNADDTNGHGTTCAGISTGTGAPEGTYMGAAPGASLVDLRIGTIAGASPGEGPESQYDAAISATHWAREHAGDQWAGAPPENAGIDILSLSWGIPWEGSTDGSDAYSRALDELTDVGVVTVVAAGNDGPDNEGFTGMGSADKVITVGALDDMNTILRDDDDIASYSSRGPRDDDGDDYPYDELKPDVSAPGTNIEQAEYSRVGDAAGNGYGSRGSGTSYATPYVAGVAALMLEANQNLTPSVVKEILRTTAERMGEPTNPELDPFWNKDFGWGSVDAWDAVRTSFAIEDPSAIDVDYQCFITNATQQGNKMLVEGMAWARVGELDYLQVRVGNGSWLDVPVGGGDENQTWGHWTATVSIPPMDGGNATVEARSVGGESYSVPDLLDVQVTTVVGEDTAGAGISSAVLGLIGLLALAAVGYVLLKRRKAAAPKAEPVVAAAETEPPADAVPE